MTKESIIKAFKEHFRNSSKQHYSDFYVGITDNVTRRLFGEHNVDKDRGWWIWQPADSKSIAQEVENYFLDKGMKGAPGGGNDGTVFVYCYEVTQSTVE